MKLIEDITAIIETYDNLPRDFNDIQRLLNARKSLSVLSYNLSLQVADYKHLYEMAYLKRKLNHSRLKQSSEGTNADREDKAIIGNAENLKTEKENEAMYSKLKIILGQVNEVSDSMSQYISYLKLEKQNG